MVKKFLLGHGQNGCGQFCLWILKLTLSEEWIDGVCWYFACWYNFTQIKRWLEIFGVSMLKNECGKSGGGTLKLTVSEEWTHGINWFFSCWYMVTKDKNWSKLFWVGLVKNGCGQSDHRNQKWTDGIKSFFFFILVQIQES